MQTLNQSDVDHDTKLASTTAQIQDDLGQIYDIIDVSNLDDFSPQRP